MFLVTSLTHLLHVCKCMQKEFNRALYAMKFFPRPTLFWIICVFFGLNGKGFREIPLLNRRFPLVGRGISPTFATINRQNMKL